ncbi:type IV pilus modification PilV family protein [Bacillus sp. FJAT-45350]|uniref:type IV pilus modification PilV family protein n=1 Tax=Bacillus sp. FJAT-45350 TaxID=2011014 RepID=UPI000BB6F83A|nr:prepilin-type N-terminal cleavage/methylation domain-containing protein [Bacillus sp. FJAT-45350]
MKRKGTFFPYFNSKGITIIELLAALTIIGFVIAGSYALIVQSFTFNNILSTNSQERLDTRILKNQLVDNLFYKSNKLIETENINGNCGFVLSTNQGEYYLPEAGTDGILVKEIEREGQEQILSPYVVAEDIRIFSWSSPSLINNEQLCHSGNLSTFHQVSLELTFQNNIKEIISFSLLQKEDALLDQTKTPTLEHEPSIGDATLTIHNNDSHDVQFIITINGINVDTQENYYSSGSHNIPVPLLKDNDEIVIWAKADNKRLSIPVTFIISNSCGSITEITKPPGLKNIPKAGDNSVTIINHDSAPAKITIERVNNNTFTIETNFISPGEHQIQLTHSIASGDEILITAKVECKITSKQRRFNVTDANSNFKPGYVIEEDSEGNQTIVPLQPKIILTAENTNQKLIITSSVGTVKFEESVIEYSAPLGVVVEEGVQITGTVNGNQSITLTSTNGDIIINGADFTSDGNSQHSYISLNGNNIEMEGSKLTAVKRIDIFSRGYIKANRAVLNSTGSGNSGNAESVDFRMTSSNSSDKLYVQDMEFLGEGGVLTKDGSSTIENNENNQRICGNLKQNDFGLKINTTIYKSFNQCP